MSIPILLAAIGLILAVIGFFVAPQPRLNGAAIICLAAALLLPVLH